MRYQVYRKGLMWKWSVDFGPSGLSFSKSTGKKRALAAIEKMERLTKIRMEPSAKTR